MLFSGLGQQQHYFDSRLTYHASRSAMVQGMSGGYVPGLANTWPSYGVTGAASGYPASAYLGYNTGLSSAGSQTSYSASALASPYTGTSLDPGSLGLVTSGTSGPATGSTGLTSDSASPAGKHHHMICLGILALSRLFEHPSQYLS